MQCLKAKFHMSCGCVLYKDQLVFQTNKLICPEHMGKVLYAKRPCSRCGEMITTHAYGLKTLFCDECQRLINLARSTYLNQDSFIDPILWHKEPSEIGLDIAVNTILNRNEIQVNEPLSRQYKYKHITIDIGKKIEELKKEAS